MFRPCDGNPVLTDSPAPAAFPLEAPLEALREVVRRFGTPTYAYDLAQIRAQVRQLRTHLPPEVEVYYSLKANASLGLCQVLADCGLGADVASAGELVTALRAGFPPARIFLTGPDRAPPVLALLRSLPEVILSVDSVSELGLLAALDSPGAGGRSGPRRVLLRLRPDFCSFATCAAGPDSRFGLTLDDVPACRPFVLGAQTSSSSEGTRIVGFHVFAGSQVLATEGVIHHLRGGLDLARRAADLLGMTPEIIDLGGGFGIPYGPADQPLDLALLGQELRTLAARAAPARLVIELGRFLIAPSGWYLTTVLAQQKTQGCRAVVVDGGTHQRADMCGLDLRRKAFSPLVLGPGPNPPAGNEGPAPTHVLGCLSLPGDMLSEGAVLPPLPPGAVLAYPNAGAYGLSASAFQFHAHPAPAEVAFEGPRLQALRPRQSPEAVLDHQLPLDL